MQALARAADRIAAEFQATARSDGRRIVGEESWRAINLSVCCLLCSSILPILLHFLLVVTIACFLQPRLRILVRGRALRSHQPLRPVLTERAVHLVAPMEALEGLRFSGCMGLRVLLRYLIGGVSIGIPH